MVFQENVLQLQECHGITAPCALDLRARRRRALQKRNQADDYDIQVKEALCYLIAVLFEILQDDLQLEEMTAELLGLLIIVLVDE